MECVRFVAPPRRPTGLRDGYSTRPGIDPDQKATGSAVAEPIIADVDQRVPAAEFLDRSGVVRGHEARTGEHRKTAARLVGVGGLEVHEDDRQVTLEVLLLIDGEGDIAGLNRIEQFRRHIEATDGEVDAQVLGGGEGRHGDDRTDAEHAVDRRVGLEDGLDAVDLLSLVGVEADELGDDVTVEGLKTGATLGEADVRLLPLGAEDLAGTEVVEPQTSAPTGDVLGLTDVGGSTNGGVVVQARWSV